jgi:hypothetical protein
MRRNRPDRDAWLSAMNRSSSVFTPPYKPAPLTFRGQLWAALTRSTPAFTGARLRIGVAPEQDRTASVLDIAKSGVVTPTFLNRDRAGTFAQDRGRVLALTLARDRELGLDLAREFTRNCADFLGRIFRSDNPYTSGENLIAGADEFYNFFCRVEQAHALALALDRVLARDLSHTHVYLRSHRRRQTRAVLRSRARARFRPPVHDQRINENRISSKAVEGIFALVDAFCRCRPVTVTSSRARDLSLELSAAFDLLRISYTMASELSLGLHQDLSATDLSYTDLPNAQLASASLRAANFHSSHLYKANLSGADLSAAHLVGATLRGADLSGCPLIGADLSYADLRGADLSRADMSRATPTGVVWSRTTTWPAAFEHEMWARSTEIEPGVFQVDEGGERSPLKELEPIRH